MEVWFNPSCSKSRAAKEALDEAGVAYTLRRYLDEPPSAQELEDLLEALDLQPWDITRVADPRAAELGVTDLPHEDRDAWVRLLASHPELIQRPILLTADGTAHIGRTAEGVQQAIAHESPAGP